MCTELMKPQKIEIIIVQYNNCIFFSFTTPNPIDFNTLRWNNNLNTYSFSYLSQGWKAYMYKRIHSKASDTRRDKVIIPILASSWFVGNWDALQYHLGLVIRNIIMVYMFMNDWGSVRYAIIWSASIYHERTLKLY